MWKNFLPNNELKMLDLLEVSGCDTTSLFRIAMKVEFFKWINLFDSNKQVTLHDIEEWLRYQEIDENLVKDFITYRGTRNNFCHNSELMLLALMDKESIEELEMEIESTLDKIVLELECKRGDKTLKDLSVNKLRIKTKNNSKVEREAKLRDKIIKELKLEKSLAESKLFIDKK